MIKYVDKGFSRYIELKSELGLPLDILEYKNINDLDQISKYADFTKVINDPNIVGTLSVINIYNETIKKRRLKMTITFDITTNTFTFDVNGATSFTKVAATIAKVTGLSLKEAVLFAELLWESNSGVLSYIA